MEKLAKTLAKSLRLKKTAFIFLWGDLGSGKTTLTQMILKVLGYKERVKSPSYSLVEPYDFNGLKIYHLDLYRIQDSQELYFMGLPELFQEQALFFIEWPERLTALGIKPDIQVFLAMDYHHAEARTVRIEYA